MFQIKIPIFIMGLLLFQLVASRPVDGKQKGQEAPVLEEFWFEPETLADEILPVATVCLASSEKLNDDWHDLLSTDTLEFV